MNILMIAPQPFYSDRGTPMNERLLVKVLGEAGHSVDLLVFPAGQDIELTNVRIIRLPNILRIKYLPIGPSLIKVIFNVLMVFAVLWHCIRNNYDAIHGIEEGGIMAVAFGRIFGKPSIMDLDSWLSDQLYYSGFMRNSFLLKQISNIEEWAVRNSSLSLTVCSALTERVRHISSTANVVQIEDIPFPEINEFHQETVERLIGRFNLRDYCRITYTGNLEKYQGIDMLIDAWEIFMKNDDGIIPSRLVIVGGPVEKVEHYKKIAKRKNLGDSICWVGPWPLGEIGAWMALSDVLVSPRSEGENSPLKIFSYMAAHRPIVATRKVTHTQVLDDETAFLAEPQPDTFALALERAVRERNEAAKKSDLAKKRVDEKYSYSVFARKLLDAYDSITGFHEKRPSTSLKKHL
jgi:glycosyltransferase involved in cell wall biosynthesis